jgi:regulator of sirC expression with transglutaminase-like and TPR domain
VPVAGVGMPGHFLVRPAGGDANVWFDPFHGGRRLDEDACRALFDQVRGAGAAFDADYLAPATTAAIVGRMLANLQHSLMQREPSAVAWVLRLRLRTPGVPTDERVALANLLGTLGRFAEAADELDAIAAPLEGELAGRARRQAAALRARGN